MSLSFLITTIKDFINMVKARVDSSDFFSFWWKRLFIAHVLCIFKRQDYHIRGSFDCFLVCFFNFFGLIVSFFRVVNSWQSLEMVSLTTSQCDSPGTSFPADWGLSEFLVKGEQSAWPLPSHCLCAALCCDVLCVSCACVHVHACPSPETGGLL